MDIWQIVVFIVATAILIYISRASLANPRSHGFFRFFAWELMTALILLNIVVWFVEPFAWHQIISWILLIVCIIPLVFGIRALRSMGRPDKSQRAESELLAFERTTKLVTDGIYHYIRHPLYSSLFLLTWGVFFKNPSWIGIILAFAATLFLVATAKADEKECTQIFGVEYQSYMKQTRMFIPYVF